MRRTLLAALLGALIMLVATSLVRPPAAASRTPVSLEHAAVEAALDRPLPEVSIVGGPFEAAMAKLGQVAGVPIVVDRATIEGDGIKLAEDVTIRVRHRTLDQILNDLLGLGRHSASGMLFTAENGAVVISSRKSLGRRGIVRAYDVADLLTTFDPATPLAAYMRYAGETGRPYYGEDVRPAEQRAMALRSLVIDQAASGTWNQSRWPDVGEAHVIGGRLVVVQTWAGHREVRRLLDRLRVPVPPVAPPPAVPPPDPSLAGEVWEPLLGKFVPVDPAVAEAALRRRVPEVSLDAVTLAEAVAAIARLWGADVALDAEASVRADVDLGRRFNLRLRNPTLAAALRAAGDAHADAHALTNPVRFEVRGGAVVVTTRHRELPTPAHLWFTRVYDMRDWFDRAAPLNAEGSPEVAFMRSNRDEWRSPYETCAEELLGMVKAMSVDLDWQSHGSGSGAVEVLDGHAVVRQTSDGHAFVARLLDDLRRTQARGPLSRPAATNPVPADAASAAPQSSPAEVALAGVPRRRDPPVEHLPLAEAVERLRDAAGGGALAVDWAALEAAGVAPDRPARLQLDGALTLAQALDQLLASTDASAPLAFTLDDGHDGVVITSREAAGGERAPARVYDVRDLVTDSRFWPGLPDRPPPRTAERQHADALCALARAALEYHENSPNPPWVVGGQLVVRGPYRSQRAVGALLAQLRRRGAPTAAAATQPAVSAGLP